MDAALADALAGRQRPAWRAAGIAYGLTQDLWHLHARAADAIEAVLGAMTLELDPLCAEASLGSRSLRGADALPGEVYHAAGGRQTLRVESPDRRIF